MCHLTLSTKTLQTRSEERKDIDDMMKEKGNATMKKAKSKNNVFKNMIDPGVS